MLAGKRGTWNITFTPHAPLPQGAQVAFRNQENEFRFAYRHQHSWPGAANYVTVEDEHEHCSEKKTRYLTAR